jgi:hypothetical protein
VCKNLKKISGTKGLILDTSIKMYREIPNLAKISQQQTRPKYGDTVAGNTKYFVTRQQRKADPHSLFSTELMKVSYMQ